MSPKTNNDKIIEIFEDGLRDFTIQTLDEMYATSRKGAKIEYGQYEAARWFIQKLFQTLRNVREDIRSAEGSKIQNERRF